MELRILLAAVLPFVVAAAALFPAALLAGRRRRAPGLALEVPRAGAVALVGAYVVCQLTLIPGLPWPAIAASERLFWIVPAAGLVGAWGAGGGRGRCLALFASPMLAFLGSAWLLERAREHQFPGLGGWVLVVLVAMVTRMVSGGVAVSARRRPGAFTPALLALVAAGAAGLLVLGRSALLGQLSGGLAAALAAAALIALWRPALTIAGGATSAFAFAYAGLLLIGAAYAYLPWSAALLAAFAPIAPAFAELPGLRTLRPLPHASARLLLALTPLAGALLLAWQALPEPYEY